MPHRDDHEAALARADALEVELQRERGDRSERVQRLEAEIAQARSKLAHMEHELSQLGPTKQRMPAPAPPQPAAPTRPTGRTPSVPERSPTPTAAFVVVAAIAVLVALARCGSHSNREERRPPASTAPTAPTAPTPPFAVDQLVHSGLAMLGDDRVTKIQIDYVDADGMLDPAYGAISIETMRPPPPKPPDDPSRPTGAPTGNQSLGFLLERCAAPRWSPHNGWTARNGDCVLWGTPPAGPTCTPAHILKRAQNDGAPQGLARITAEWTMAIDATHDAAFRWQWTFHISDANRGIDFQRTYDDCAPGR